MDYKKQIQESINYINNNLCENLNLKDIAKQAYLSEFHFHRIFKKNTGISVMRYVRKKRLENAAQKLESTDEKINDIALDYQFSTGESFSRAFKKIYKKSPRDYRKLKNPAIRSNMDSMCG